MGIIINAVGNKIYRDKKYKGVSIYNSLKIKDKTYTWSEPESPIIPPDPGGEVAKDLKTLEYRLLLTMKKISDDDIDEAISNYNETHIDSKINDIFRITGEVPYNTNRFDLVDKNNSSKFKIIDRETNTLLCYVTISGWSTSSGGNDIDKAIVIYEVAQGVEAELSMYGKIPGTMSVTYDKYEQMAISEEVITFSYKPHASVKVEKITYTKNKYETQDYIETIFKNLSEFGGAKSIKNIDIQYSIDKVYLTENEEYRDPKGITYTSNNNLPKFYSIWSECEVFVNTYNSGSIYRTVSSNLVLEYDRVSQEITFSIKDSKSVVQANGEIKGSFEKDKGTNKLMISVNLTMDVEKYVSPYENPNYVITESSNMTIDSYNITNIPTPAIYDEFTTEVLSVQNNLAVEGTINNVLCYYDTLYINSKKEDIGFGFYATFYDSTYTLNSTTYTLPFFQLSPGLSYIADNIKVSWLADGQLILESLTPDPLQNISFAPSILRYE